MATSDAVAEHLRTVPSDIVPFLYTALDAASPDDDIAIRTTLEILQREWITYANVYRGTPTLLLRAVIFDALVAVAGEDEAVQNALAVLIASTIPNIDLGSEAALWTEALLEIQEQVERRAEQEWSVPSRIEVPVIELGKQEPLKIPTKLYSLKLESLTEGLFAASGPNNPQNEAIEGANPHWSNAAQNWSNEFVPRAAQAIKNAVDPALKIIVGPIDTNSLLVGLTEAVSAQLDTVLTRVANATHGLELRSRLLWWKEAFYSPSSGLSYRDVDALIACGLMAYDFQIPLPSLTPASVTAFLRETVANLVLNDGKIRYSLKELLVGLLAADGAAPLRTFIADLELGGGRRPLVTCLRDGVDLDVLIEEQTVFDPNRELTLADFSVLIFLELQTLKAVQDITPKRAGSKKQ